MGTTADMTHDKMNGDPWRHFTICGAEMGDRFLHKMVNDRANNTNTLPGDYDYLCLNNTVEVENANGDEEKKVEKHFKYDFVFAGCYSDVEYMWQEDDTIAALDQSYELFIVGVGIWEEVKNVE